MIFTLKNILSSAVAALVLFGGASASAEEVRLKLGHVAQPSHPFHTGALKLAELAKKYSNGEVIVDVFPASQIGNERDMIEGARLGTIDMLLTSSGPVMGFEKRFGVLDMPYIFRDVQHAHKVLDGEVGALLFAALEPKGLKGLAWFENGFRNITNSKHEIKTAEDLKGLKIRTIENPIHIAYFKKLGAVPQPMAFGELYPALEKKVVDGQENPIGAIVTGRFYEVQKYVSMTGHVYSGVPVLMSLKRFNGLSKTQQAALQRAATEAAAFERSELASQDEEGLALLRKNGVTITMPDPTSFALAAEPVRASFADKTDPELLRKIVETK
jgi:tripartite ATP-independent transporter DctP family solute receptor